MSSLVDSWRSSGHASNHHPQREPALYPGTRMRWWLGLAPLTACGLWAAWTLGPLAAAQLQATSDPLQHTPGPQATPLQLRATRPALAQRNPAATGPCARELALALAAAHIVFEPDSAQINSVGAQALEQLAQIVGTCPGVLRIQGHADAQGSDENNLALSLDRAAALRAALITRGVAPEKLIAQGLGAQHPIGDNLTEAGRAQNRRIEFHLANQRS